MSLARSASARGRRAALLALAGLGAFLALGATGAQAAPFIAPFQPNPGPLATTVPPNGDINPYGIVTVPTSVGNLQANDLLISNFNNKKNLQGTGTTIVQLPQAASTGAPGTAPVFAHIRAGDLPGPCPGGIGLTTALAVTRSGFVIVGSLPTTDGTSATAEAGCLIVLNSQGKVVETIAGGPINGPWDMTAVDNGFITTLYVSNVLNGTLGAHGNVVDEGTVVRIELLTVAGMFPSVLGEDVIATGFPERTDPNALVIGPTGLAIGPNSTTLYVADTLDNRIARIPNAPSRMQPAPGGQTLSQGGDLNGPLGLTFTPNGHVLAANGNDGNMVETNQGGGQVATKQADPVGAGDLFGLTVAPGVDAVYFVDDGTNSLDKLAPSP
jgi:hypothetical protein